MFFFDVLGFSNRVKEMGLSAIYDKYVALTELVKSSFVGAGFLIRDTPDASVDDEGNRAILLGVGVMDFASMYFSDTMLMWCTWHEMTFDIAIDSVLDFFCESLILDLPLRGAVSFGQAIMDPRHGVFLGEPIIEAYKAEEGQKWAGISFGPSVARPQGGDRRNIGPPHRFLRYKAQIKDPADETVYPLALDWPRRFREKHPDMDLNRLLARYIESGHPYWQTTLTFVEYSVGHHDWFLKSGLDQGFDDLEEDQ